MADKPKYIVLLSGGMDLATLLALACQQFDTMALTLNYGQRHRVEIESARAVAAHFGVPHKVMDISNINDLLQGSSLTTPEIAVPQGHYEDESMKATVVPGRNTILLSLALGYCISQNGQMVAYAAHAGDHAIYPDCRPEFVLAMAGVFNKAHYYPVALWVPFLSMDKGDILTAGIPLGVPYESTWTCYDPQKRNPNGPWVACGLCGACQERLAGFAKIRAKRPSQVRGGSMIYYGAQEFKADCELLAENIKLLQKPYKAIHGIPQGGTAIALELGHLLGLPIIEESQLNARPADQVLIVDDLVDSGATISRYKEHDTACIHIKTHTPEDKWPTFWISKASDWITYWWEASEEKSIRDNVTRILQFIGEDPNREGLVKTPDRVVKSWGKIFEGYKMDPAAIFTTFEPDGYNQLVLLKNVEFYSNCEHHIQPFFGKAHIGYIAQDRIVGISKLARLLDIYARRLQIQERIGQQVTSDLMKYLKPAGAACIIEAEHLCMRCRGVEKQNSVMVTSSLTGRFLEDSDGGRAARAELMGLIK